MFICLAIPWNSFINCQLKQITDIADLVPNERVRILYMCARFERFERKRANKWRLSKERMPARSVSNDFPIVYRQVRSLIEENAVLYIEGKVEVSRYNGEINSLLIK